MDEETKDSDLSEMNRNLFNIKDIKSDCGNSAVGDDNDSFEEDLDWNSDDSGPSNVAVD